MLRLPSNVYDKMVQQAIDESPMECCGLICGNAQIVEIKPLRNHMRSPTRYEADPSDLLGAFRDMRHRQLDLLAIYHSHPTSPAFPSKVDLRENYYGTVPRIIVSLLESPPDVRAFMLRESTFDEIGCERTI